MGSLTLLMISEFVIEKMSAYIAGETGKKALSHKRNGAGNGVKNGVETAILSKGKRHE
jgi:hypothetical protein